MLESLVGLVIDESKWLTASMVIALLTVAGLVARRSSHKIAADRFALACMTMFSAAMIGTMAFGHLLAVSTKLALGTIEGPIPIFYLIGVALAAPSWMLIGHTRAVLTPGFDHARRTVVLNGWLVASLLALGPQNLPLAMPSALNIGHHLSRRRAVRWAIVGLAVVANAGLFVGSMIFLLSGQSFEDFSGMP